MSVASLQMEFIVRVKIMSSRVLVRDGYIGLRSRLWCMRGDADAAVQCVATGRRVVSVVSWLDNTPGLIGSLTWRL